MNNEINILKPIIRDEKGLRKDIPYIFDEFGLIDWKSMIIKLKPEYLIPNSMNFVKRGEEVPVSIEGIKDSDLIIRLAGLQYLAYLKGYKSIEFRPIIASIGYSCVVCRIIFLGNYETEGRDIIFESVADASFENTTGFSQNYLSSIAENRAFCRCVRRFCRLDNIISDEEFSDKIKDPNAPKESASPVHIELLKNIMDKKHMTFDEIKSKLISEKYENAENFKSIEDIPKDKIFDLIERLKRIKLI